jgi:predicted Fe-Mo cluster-binding NifX family protein
MKVAFPTNNGEKIARHASLCKSFLIVDIETGKRVTVANPLKDEGIVPHQGDHAGEGERLRRGTGRIVPELLAGQGSVRYVCLEAGAGLQSRLEGRGIRVSVVTEKRIDEVLKHLDALQPAAWSAEVPAVATHGHGEDRREGRRCETRGRRGRGHGLKRGEGHDSQRGNGRSGQCDGGHGRGHRARCRH